MRIRQGPEYDSLELRSGTSGGANMIIAGGVVAFGTILSVVIGLNVAFGFRGSSTMSTPWPALFAPVVFLIIGLLFVSQVTRVHTVLRRHGESHTRISRWFGLKKEEFGFNAAAGHHLLLHTDKRINRSDKGTRRYRISTLVLVVRDGAEYVIGKQQRGGWGGNQPLLEQSGEIALFLGLPLERTGYGAPLGYDMPPGGVAGPPPVHGHPGQYPPGQHPGPPPAHGHGPQQHGGHQPGDGGGLPGWTRGPGH